MINVLIRGKAQGHRQGGHMKMDIRDWSAVDTR